LLLISTTVRVGTPENPFWENMSAEYIITELMAIPIGAGIGQIRADMEQIINGLQEYQRVFTDRSLIGNKVGCAIATTQTNIKTCRTDNDI
jgi:hypothetical protein